MGFPLTTHPLELCELSAVKGLTNRRPQPPRSVQHFALPLEATQGLCYGFAKTWNDKSWDSFSALAFRALKDLGSEAPLTS